MISANDHSPSEDKRQASIELLKQNHDFPDVVMLKAIGKNERGFLGRVVAAVRDRLGLDEDPPYRSRATANGKHIAVTMEPTFESAEQVLDAYDAIKGVEGVVMVL